ncbi:MAG: sugar transporter ATP-binding protein [Enterobacter kobei]|nr:sugar transporter ATP-binding protein [Enterobacter kobei]
MTALTLRNIHKHYDKNTIIENLSLEIASGEFIVLVGPSGCGKSTLLRIIAGLESADGGTLLMGDEEVTHQPAGRRSLSMVFQSYALYPHMTVRQNLSFGLKNMKTPPAEIAQRIDGAAKMLRLEALLDRLPQHLSGGQRQRVAIGRSIVQQPEVFLFDEPLSNLDAALRVEMRQEIQELHNKLGNTMIYVTHDQVEAMTLADRIVVLNKGTIEQTGTPLELYNTPANRFVAEFIGTCAALPATTTARRRTGRADAVCRHPPGAYPPGQQRGTDLQRHHPAMRIAGRCDPGVVYAGRAAVLPEIFSAAELPATPAADHEHSGAASASV